MDMIRSKVKAITTDVPLEDGTLEVIVNSGKLDRQGEVLDIAGLDLSNYLESPVVAFGHKYDEPAIGKALNIWKDSATGALKAKIKFAINEYPFAKLIYDLYKGDYMRAFSIGFIPLEADEKDGNVVYTKSEMLEFSAVLVGADPRALATAKSMGGDDAEKVLTGEMHIKDFKGIVEEKEVIEKTGRVLSKKNRSAVTNAINALQAVLDEDSKNTDSEKTEESSDKIITPLEIAEKAVSGIKEIVESGGRTDYTKVKTVAQILDKAAEEIIRRSNKEAGYIKIKRRIK